MKIFTKVKTKTGPDGGFTLVEQLIAAGIMAIVLTSLFLTLNFTNNMTELTQENLRATQILAGKMELMRLYTWQQITNGLSIPQTFTDYSVSGITNLGPVFNGTVAITTPLFSNNYIGSLRMVTVTVTWSSGNVTHSRQDYTLVSNNGLQAYVY